MARSAAFFEHDVAAMNVCKVHANVSSFWRASSALIANFVADAIAEIQGNVHGSFNVHAM